ncbi:MAG: transcriptional regulator NrdR [Actinomycetia bacterium]|nr:transcriptional regulator NrdR [Actinomycetes bacterium]
MFCPYCRHSDSRVLDSRVSDDGLSIRRRRQCPICERRFTTLEQMQLMVTKRAGVQEPFNRDKVVAGVRKACKDRPVSEADLTRLGQQVEEALRASGQCDVPSEAVGAAILAPLRRLDAVAYLRFASVYQHYQTLDDFAAEIDRLTQDPPGHDDGPGLADGSGATVASVR